MARWKTVLALLVALALATPETWAQATTVDFDDPRPPGASFDLLQGVFQDLDFGVGQWRWEGAYANDPTNHVFFASSGGTSRTFAFSPAPRILTELDVFSSFCGTLTITDDTGQRATLANLCPGSVRAMQTGWTRGSTTVSVQFSRGWALGISRLLYRPAATCPCDFSVRGVAAVTLAAHLPPVCVPFQACSAPGVATLPSCGISVDNVAEEVRVSSAIDYTVPDGRPWTVRGGGARAVTTFLPPPPGGGFCTRDIFTSNPSDPFSTTIAFIETNVITDPTVMAACRADLLAAAAALGVEGCPVR